MVLMTAKCAVCYLLLGLLLLWRCQPGSGITCFCSHSDAQFNHCSPNNTCIGEVGCTLTHDLVDESSENILYDCLDSVIASNLCNIDTSTRRRACCSDIDLCNLHLMVEPFLPVTTKDPEVTTESATPQVVSTGDLRNPLYRKVTITVPIISAFIIIFIIVATPTFLCLLRRRKRRIERLRRRHDEREPSPVYSPYSLDTVDLENMTCTSGSGSGAPLLTQRTVARCIKIGENIGSGRFGQVYVGVFQGDKVAIKKFASRDEKSWFRETEIYSTVLLRHDNILGFFASDVFSSVDGVTELWLITQFHPCGSLYDYLNAETIPPKTLIRMAQSTCNGLCHLHTEFFGTSAKPAIAHRDIKSKNILVKNNRECCIADFGLAVMKGNYGDVNFPTNPKQGTKRYMAPEILDETIDMRSMTAFKKADIYAFGLVLWEMCKRCAEKNDSVHDYEPPFHGLVPPDPTFEDMRKVVVLDRKQPAIPVHWRNNELFQGMLTVMRECWYFNSNARNDALFYKTKLTELTREDKLNFDVQE